MSSKSSQTQNQSGTTSSTTNPWSVQQPYLTQAFSGAQNALGQAQGNAQIPSQFTASYSPDAIAAFKQMLATGASGNGAPQSSAAAGATASGAGAQGIQNGVTGLGAFTPQGGTQSNIDAANQYVAGQNIPAQVKAAMQSANEEANYVTNPNIDATAAAGGNINSSRDAIEHGLVAKTLGEQAGNLSANLQGQAYNSGLSLAEQNNEAANNERLAALTGELSGGASGLYAGTGANTGSVAQQGGLYNIAQSGISGEQAAAQAPLTNAQQAFAANTNDPFQALQNYYGIVGANNWGGTTSGTSSGTSTTTSNPSTAAQIGGWTNFIGSLL